MHYIKTFSTNSQLRTQATKILLGIVAFAAMANISIPIQPVPINLSSLMVMILGLTYSSKEAFITVISYLTIGALGVPVFANFGCTITYMIGPTGGYLLGFLISAYSMAFFKEKYNLPALYNCIIGHIFIYIPGILWLSRFIGIDTAIYKGFIIYLPTGILKIGMLVTIMKIIKK